MADYDYGQLIDDFELGVDVMPDEDLTAYIERRRREFESKADGGSIGIEILFNDKMKNGGRVPAVSGGFLKLLAEGGKKGKQGIMELVESGKGKFDEFVETMNQSKKPSELIDESIQVTKKMRDGPITIKMLEDMNPDTVKKLLRSEEIGLYGSQRPEALIAADMIKRFTKADGTIDYERAEIILNRKLKGNESLDELLEIEFTTRPDKIPDEGLADGGRVGLFMGGSPLEGQALSIYNSMNAYGFQDQEIADALSAQGLYTAPGSGTPDITPGNTIGYQGGGGGGDNFSVYNPDPNSIRSIKQDPAIQSNLEAIQRNQQLQSMGIKDPFANEQDPANAYYGDMFEDTSNQIGKQSMFAKAKQGLSGIVGDVKGLMDSPIGNAIGFAINPIMGGIKGIASFANRMLPANERAIQENIMGNMGFAVNDIGQIVSRGDYDDPENVMAGYNLSRMTPETFMKRIASIKNRKAAQTDASRRRIAAIQEAQRKFEAAEKLKRLAVEEANLRKGRAPGGGRFDGGQAAYTNPDTGVGGGQFTDSLGNQDYQDAYDPGGGEKDGGIIGYQNGGLATMFTRRR